jgi:hypothetical protein
MLSAIVEDITWLYSKLQVMTAAVPYEREDPYHLSKTIKSTHMLTRPLGNSTRAILMKFMRAVVGTHFPPVLDSSL